MVNVAIAICGTSMGAVTLVDADRQWFKARHGFDSIQGPREESFCAEAILEPERLMLVEDTLEDPRFNDHPAVTGGLRVRFYAGVPLLNGEGLPLGTLCVFNERPGTLSDSQADALRALARQASHLLELRRTTHALNLQIRERDWYEQQLDRYSQLLEERNADLTEQNRIDPLTGLPNRRAFSVALGAAIERAGGEGLPLSVALLDLDHFKTINDVHGHAEGDRVLAETGTLLKSYFAAAGMAARYGGEEFAVLMPDTALEQARLQCEFLRQASPRCRSGWWSAAALAWPSGSRARNPARPSPVPMRRCIAPSMAAATGSRSTRPGSARRQSTSCLASEVPSTSGCCTSGSPAGVARRLRRPSSGSKNTAPRDHRHAEVEQRGQFALLAQQQCRQHDRVDRFEVGRQLHRVGAEVPQRDQRQRERQQRAAQRQHQQQRAVVQRGHHQQVAGEGREQHRHQRRQHGQGQVPPHPARRRSRSADRRARPGAC